MDRVPFYQNEQFASGDLNALQAVIQRYAQDLAGYPHEAVNLTLASSVAANSDTVRQVVLGGLEGSQSGADLTIGPGLALYVPTITPDDPPLSSGVFAVNDADQGITIPLPETDTWWLVVGVPAEVNDAATTRRVWSPGDGAWGQQLLVKRTRARMTFTLIEGTSDEIPLAASPEQIPLYAVKRTAAGSEIDALVDLRPLTRARRVRNTSSVALEHNHWRLTPFTGTATTLKVNAHVRFDDLDLHAVGDVSPDAILSASAPALAAHVWRYLYLVPLPFSSGEPLTLLPRHAQAGLKQQGLLVLSHIAPQTGDDFALEVPRTNSAPFLCPAPFGGSPIPANGAAFLGAIKRNAANDGWVAAQCDGDEVRGLGATSYSVLPPLTLLDLGASTSRGRVPFGARAVEVLLTFSDSTAVTGTVDVVSVSTSEVVATLGMPGTTDNSNYRVARWLPIANAGNSLILAFSGDPLDAAFAQVLGYRI